MNKQTPAASRASLEPRQQRQQQQHNKRYGWAKAIFDLRFTIYDFFLVAQASRLCVSGFSGTTGGRLRPSAGSVSSTSRSAEECNPQLIFARLVFGEFHEVAALQKSAEAFLLFARQQICPVQFVQNSSVVRSGARKSNRSSRYVRAVSDTAMTNGFGCAMSASASCSFCFARMCACTGGAEGICPPFLPVTPREMQNRQQRHARQCPPDQIPSVGNFHRRLDIADIVDNLWRRVGDHASGLKRRASVLTGSALPL